MMLVLKYLSKFWAQGERALCKFLTRIVYYLWLDVDGTTAKNGPVATQEYHVVQ